MATEASLLPSDGSADADRGWASVTATAEVILANPHSHEHTNSVNRSYSDLDSGSFLLYAFALCAARTALQQPLNLALARKQTSSAYAALSTQAIVQRVFRKEGGLRGLSQGMLAMTLGCALSEVIYLFLFEYWRERAPLPSDAQRDAAAGYGADAVCRCVHLPLSIIAFRQMTAASTPATHPAPPPASPAVATVRANLRSLRTRLRLRGLLPNEASLSLWQRYPDRGARLWGPRTLVPAHNAWHTLRAMYRENGIRAVFAGYGTTLMIGCQWSALWWALYGAAKTKMYAVAAPLLLDSSAIEQQRVERSREHRRGQGNDSNGSGGGGGEAGTIAWLQHTLPSWCLAKDDNFIINSVASILTGASTAVVFNPFLVVRTNLQTTPMATLRSATAGVYKARGLRGFYSGLWLSITTCVFDGVLASTSYEYAKLWADTSRTSKATTSREVFASSGTSRPEAVALVALPSS